MILFIFAIMKQDLIFGIRAVIEAIKSGKQIEKIVFKKGLQGELFNELHSIARNYNIPFQFVPIERINRISRKNHQGVIAFISPIAYHKIEDIIPQLYEDGKEPFILILDGITDVRNFGAIVRTAECANINAIVIPDRGSVRITADAIKTSAGALLSLPVCRSVDVYKTIKYLQDMGIYVVGATEKAQDYYFSTDFNQPLAILMGSEDVGVRSNLLKITNKNVKIPILGKIESLNVSVATSVIVYEAVKQKMNNL